MTGLVVTDAGEQDLLNAYLTAIILGGGHSLKLYTNDPTTGLTPDQIDLLTAGSFTQATFPGYAAVTVNSGWTFAQGNPTVATNTPRSFTRSSTGTPQSITGYYVTRVDTGALAWFERFLGPVVMEFINDQVNVTPRLTLDDTGGNNVESGTIVATGRATAPTGWLLCNGAAVSRSTFDALFAAIGIAYGAGDGSTTFNVPDLRQRVPLGKAASGTGATLGGTGGTIDHVHGLDTASSHAKIALTTGGALNPYMRRKGGVTAWSDTHHSTAAAATAGTLGSQTDAAELGGNSGTGNPPYQVVNYMIKA
jgi:microcystin-dependent protein